jgi:hypothetical protein
MRNVGTAKLRYETKVKFAELRQEMITQFAKFGWSSPNGASRDVRKCALRFANVDVKFAAMETAAAKRHADFMKWTMGFWAVSLVGAIATLSRRRP